MSIDITFLSTLIITIVAYIGLFFYILRLHESISAERWLAIYCLWSVAVAGALALSDTQTSMVSYASGMWLALASIISLCLLGAVTFDYLELPWPWLWAAAAPIVSALVFVGDYRDPAPGLAELTWQAAMVQPGGWLAVTTTLAWFFTATALIVITYFSVTRATLPLLANRRFWWVIALMVILFGEAAAMWGSGVVVIVAQAMRLIGVAVAVYATINLELVDIRGLIRKVVGNSLFVAIMAGFIIIGIVGATYLMGRLAVAQLQLAVVAIALVLSIIYQRIRPIVQSMVTRVVFATGYDATQITQGYSQRIANLIDIGELAMAVGLTIHHAVGSSRLGLLLVTADGSKTRVDVMIGSGRLPTHSHSFDDTSAFLQGLSLSRRPLSQYVLDYDPRFKSISAYDREWLRGLGVDIYVPIFDGDLLIGVMAVGARQSGDSYRQAELDLLSSLADQTSVALKNARLVTNLRILNERTRVLYESTQLLNKELAESNERLRQMDKVKTDFINIASHELRTPLTKLRGFSDMLNEMSVRGEVDSASLDMVTRQLSKACSRLEDVVGQLLDVSQLDVEALQMSFAETNIERVVQLAADSFVQAFHDRKVALTIHDMQALPLIEGDFQRLVQTFKQVIGNAIKFTPDGGQIDVYGNYLPANEDRDRPEAVEVIVADTGVGINPEHNELIFEKFYRVGSVDLHSTGDTKFMGAGPGLGLTIARGVIKSHGGQIWAESDGFDPQSCMGSRFHIILPVKHIPTSEPVPSVSAN